MKRNLFVLLIWAFFSLSFSIGHAAYVVVGYEGEPFYFKNGSEGVSGACHDLISELCVQEKTTCKFKIAQIPKMMEMLKNGEADIACPIADSPERRGFINYSPKIFKTRYAFFGPPEAAAKIKTTADLADYSVSVFGPSVTSQTLQKLHTRLGGIFTILPETAEMTSLFKSEKIAKSLAYINRDIANRWINKSHSKLVEIPVAGEDIYYHVGFSKKSVSRANFLKIESRLEKMKTAKFLVQTADKYQLKLSDESDVSSTSLKTESTAR